MPLSSKEIAFLQELQRRPEKRAILDRFPESIPGIKDLEMRGYLRFHQVIVEPLNLVTGEVFVVLTEAGEEILNSKIEGI